MPYRHVQTSVSDGVGTLTFNRPDMLNAFDRAMGEEMLRAGQELVENPAVRVLVLTGSGRAFCSGADVKFLSSSLEGRRLEDALAVVQQGNALARLLYEAPQPVLASLNGAAAGGGASLALACDFRIGSDQAAMGMVFHKIGVLPDLGATYFLPRLVGPARALELIWSAEMVPAARCLELGLLTRVVPAKDLAEETAKWAARLTALPGLAAGLAKRAVHHATGPDLATALQREYESQERCFRSYDAVEGMAAFLGKRAAHFRGH
jgi:2-(1,2-epoxy-1,2-dihydrophenyl)acetyl-CoA isomerase